jgi:hypothetical protein
MSVQIRVKTGIETNRLSYTPAMGELLVTTDTRKIYAGDGATPGGVGIGASCEVVADQIAMLASKAMPGDLVFRTDLAHVFVLTGADATVAGNWVDTDIVDATDVGLEKVQNYGISDSVDEDISGQYASSKAVYTANQRAITAEANSVAYTDQMKADLLGGAPDAALDTLLELGEAITGNDDEIAAIVNTLATKLNIDTFDAFVARTDNPHSVTKLQVGLSNVENYGVTDSVSNGLSTMYASAKGLKTAYDLAALARSESLDSQQLEGNTLAEVIAMAKDGGANDSDLQAHLSDESNPHNVTKAQVGLSNVENMNVAAILASDAVTVLASDKSEHVATTNFVQNKLVADKYIKDGDTINGGTF